MCVSSFSLLSLIFIDHDHQHSSCYLLIDSTDTPHSSRIRSVESDEVRASRKFPSIDSYHTTSESEPAHSLTPPSHSENRVNRSSSASASFISTDETLSLERIPETVHSLPSRHHKRSVSSGRRSASQSTFSNLAKSAMSSDHSPFTKHVLRSNKSTIKEDSEANSSSMDGHSGSRSSSKNAALHFRRGRVSKESTSSSPSSSSSSSSSPSSSSLSSPSATEYSSISETEISASASLPRSVLSSS